jgi:hypothetical protein
MRSSNTSCVAVCLHDKYGLSSFIVMGCLTSHLSQMTVSSVIGGEIMRILALFPRYSKGVLHSLITLVAWSLWKHPSVQTVLRQILEETSLWCLAVARIGSSIGRCFIGFSSPPGRVVIVSSNVRI